MRNINSTLLTKARTSVFIAHRSALPLFLLLTELIADPTLIIRLKTIADADVIIVLKDGVVAEMGRHQELVDLGGVYESLWHEQSSSSYVS